MKARIAAGGELYRGARVHLDGHPERFGFFLADWAPQDRLFVLKTWMPIADDQVILTQGCHVALTDDAQAAVIALAWSERSCLVEAHSHGGKWRASFSSIDIEGFEEWVPHLWWRLQGQPYGAIVTGGSTLDALVWVEGPDNPEQVDCLLIDGMPIQTTGLTLTGLTRRELGLNG